MGRAMEEGGRFGKAPAFLQLTASGQRVRGSFTIAGPLRPGQVSEGETVMCVHCQKHWEIKPGSGISRGFCFNCNGLTCGKQKCETECMPFEKSIEISEGRDQTMSQSFPGAHIL